MSVRGVRHLVSDKCILTSADCIGQVMTTISGGAASRILLQRVFRIAWGPPFNHWKQILFQGLKKVLHTVSTWLLNFTSSGESLVMTYVQNNEPA